MRTQYIVEKLPYGLQSGQNFYVDISNMTEQLDLIWCHMFLSLSEQGGSGDVSAAAVFILSTLLLPNLSLTRSWKGTLLLCVTTRCHMCLMKMVLEFCIVNTLSVTIAWTVLLLFL